MLGTLQLYGARITEGREAEIRELTCSRRTGHVPKCLRAAKAFDGRSDAALIASILHSTPPEVMTARFTPRPPRASDPRGRRRSSAARLRASRGQPPPLSIFSQRSRGPAPAGWSRRAPVGTPRSSGARNPSRVLPLIRGERPLSGEPERLANLRAFPQPTAASSFRLAKRSTSLRKFLTSAPAAALSSRGNRRRGGAYEDWSVLSGAGWHDGAGRGCWCIRQPVLPRSAAAARFRAPSSTRPGGAAGATVTATNVATGVETTRQTTEAGVYAVSPLAARRIPRDGRARRLPDRRP